MDNQSQNGFISDHSNVGATNLENESIKTPALSFEGRRLKCIFAFNPKMGLIKAVKNGPSKYNPYCFNHPMETQVQTFP